jgi:short subunit dehydrogenase-like uncharacterized protein
MSIRVLVYGASGHTGRFVVGELLRRGITPVVAGRSAARLADLPPELERRVAHVDDAAALSAAVAGVGAVVNCAGPFLDTGLPLARAAVVAGAHYLDVTAEQPAVQQLYRELDGPARAAGVAIVPAMAFFGGLADLLVTAALDGTDGTDGADGADEVEVAIGLDRWWPTAGTRETGVRNTAPRLTVRGGTLVPQPVVPPSTWEFPAPLGAQAVVALPFSEVVTIHRHLEVGELRSWLSTTSLEELRDADTLPPTAVDADGRSAQRFVVDAVVRRGAETHRARAAGRDIYAVSAPIVVEGVSRLLDGRARRTGALAPGQAFDATDVLAALERTVDGFTRGSSSGRPARA